MGGCWAPGADPRGAQCRCAVYWLDEQACARTHNVGVTLACKARTLDKHALACQAPLEVKSTPRPHHRRITWCQSCWEQTPMPWRGTLCARVPVTVSMQFARARSPRWRPPRETAATRPRRCTWAGAHAVTRASARELSVPCNTAFGAPHSCTHLRPVRCAWRLASAFRPPRCARKKNSDAVGDSNNSELWATCWNSLSMFIHFTLEFQSKCPLVFLQWF